MPINNISAEELRELITNNKDDLEIIDVREPEEYALSRIRGSRLIPSGEVLNRVSEIDWSKDVIFVCRSGARSIAVAEAMSANGKKVNNLETGMMGFSEDEANAEFLESDNA